MSGPFTLISFQPGAEERYLCLGEEVIHLDHPVPLIAQGPVGKAVKFTFERVGEEEQFSLKWGDYPVRVDNDNRLCVYPEGNADKFILQFTGDIHGILLILEPPKTPTGRCWTVDNTSEKPYITLQPISSGDTPESKYLQTQLFTIDVTS